MDAFEEKKAEENRRSHEGWKKVRLIGRKTFIWRWGVLYWGGSIASSMCLGRLIFLGDLHPIVALVEFALFAIGGYLVGYGAWKENEEILASGANRTINYWPIAPPEIGTEWADSVDPRDASTMDR